MARSQGDLRRVLAVSFPRGWSGEVFSDKKMSGSMKAGPNATAALAG